MRFPSSTLLALASIGLCLTHCQKAGPVVWPELSALDEKAERAEGLVEKHDIKTMRTFVPELETVATRFIASAIPSNAANPATTAELRNDLKDLMGKLGDVPKLSDTDLESFVAGVHPIVEQLVIQSGMPHVHELPKK